MRRFPRDPVEEFEELRRLLLSREREQLRDLRDQITDKDRRSIDVAAILPDAVKISRNRGDELSQALRPAVEDSITQWIENKPETFIGILRPIMGSIVRRWIGDSLRRLLRSFNQAVERIFSWQRVKWRFEALRTGKSFAEVMTLRSLVYRVEELFLIHRETGRALLYLSADSAGGAHSDIIADMLSAIQEFARNSFGVSAGSALVEFRVGQLQVWIALGRHAYLAAVIRGTPSRELRSTLEKTIETIHALKGSALARFNGDASAFQSLRPELESCLCSQYGATQRNGRATRVWAVLTAMVLAAPAILGILLAIRSQSKWETFVRRLNSQPGLIVTNARKGWFSSSHVTGLRDASAADPAAIAREEKLDPARIDFQWKDYLAIDPAIVMERFKHRFGVPPGARAMISDGALVLSGSVPYEWLERVRREATLFPGIMSVMDRRAQVTYDPGSALARFEEKFGLPESVHAVFAQGVLTLSGGAPHGWLSRVRSEASKVPGITSVDEGNVSDLDQRTFQQSKSILEDAFVYFLTNKDEITPEGFAVLSRLPDQINRLANAAKQIGRDVTLEIHGYADTLGEEQNQADLGLRRANKVRDFLVSCGFQSNGLKPIGMNQPLNGGDGEKPSPGQSGRGVAFKVVSPGSAP
jgi:outer membrane protein OmpA-like peptidoglycan-associated protein